MKRQKYRYKPFSARRLEKKSRRNFFLTTAIGIFLLYFSITWLIPNLIGSLSVINNFKDQPPRQKSVSEDPTLPPPVLNIPYEATNTAEIRVRGYSTSDTSVEIYVDDELVKTVDTGEDGSFTAEDIPLSLGNNAVSGKTVDEKGTKSLSSKPVLIYYSNEKPKLELSSPPDNQSITGGDKKVTVSGKTNDDGKTIVIINGIRTIVGSAGNFSQVIEINDGDNDIIVVATNDVGNTTQFSRRVTYKQPS